MYRNKLIVFSRKRVALWEIKLTADAIKDDELEKAEKDAGETDDESEIEYTGQYTPYLTRTRIFDSYIRGIELARQASGDALLIVCTDDGIDTYTTSRLEHVQNLESKDDTPHFKINGVESSPCGRMMAEF